MITTTDSEPRHNTFYLDRYRAPVSVDIEGTTFSSVQQIPHGDQYDIRDKYTDRTITVFGDEQLAAYRELDVGPIEYSLYTGIVDSADKLRQSLPESELRDGVFTALEAKAQDLIALVRRLRLGDEHDGISYDEALQATREFDFALASIAASLEAHDERSIEPYGVNIWYATGRKGRNGGYVSSYRVCNDTWYDMGDQGTSPVTNPDEFSYPDEFVYPDEYHYPSDLKITVDPEHRIEFAYKPTGDYTHGLHESQTVVEHADKPPRVFNNQALSIRIDLDDTAPAGIAVDIGRSEYKGEKLSRDGDLLGKVFSVASESGSHEYRGMTADMRTEFKNMAEMLAVQLDLQNKEVISQQRQVNLGRAAVSKAS